MTQPAAVHPHLPRFSQGITGALCLEALVFDSWPVVAVALALVVLNLIDPRISPVARLFRLVARPPATLEPATPVRFSQLLAAVLLTAAVVLFGLSQPLAAWILAALVAALALGSAISGVCIGCEVYRLLFLRKSESDDLRGDLGLTGVGPWIVVLTAPGCARCEPVARQIEAASDGRPVVRVNIVERPAAASLPVRSVPAAIAVTADGRLGAARAGRLASDDIQAVLAAV